MPGIGDHLKVGLGPHTMQVPCRLHRADDVVATLHDHAGNVPDPRHAAQQLILAAQEALVYEVMALDARDLDRELVFAPLRDVGVVGPQVTRRRFPDRPRMRRREPCAATRAGQAAVECADEVVALAAWDRRNVVLPAIGEDCASFLSFKYRAPSQPSWDYGDRARRLVNNGL